MITLTLPAKLIPGGNAREYLSAKPKKKDKKKGKK